MLTLNMLLHKHMALSILCWLGGGLQFAFMVGNAPCGAEGCTTKQD